MKEEGTLKTGTLISRIKDYVSGHKWGYIFIDASDHKSLLEISEEGIELLADSSSRWDVELLLVQRGHITETQFQNAKKIAERTNKDLKPVINEQGFATSEQFEKAARKQAWEFLLDAFLIEGASYEFRDEDRRSEVDDELKPPFKFVFDHQEVIEEATHRLSEYETQKALLSDEHKRYNINEENLPESEDIKEEIRIKRIVEGLKEGKSIRELKADLNYSMFETYKTLAVLSMSGALQPMPDEEVLEVGRRRLQEEQFKRAERIFKLYLKNHPRNLEVRKDLSDALSGSGKDEETAELLVDTAKMHLEKDEKQKANHLLKLAYKHDPRNESVRETWLEAVLDLNDPKSIRETGEELIESQIQAGNFKEASIVLDKLLDRFPYSLRLLMTGADLAKEQGDYENLRKYIERSVEVLPDEISPESLEAVEHLKKASSIPDKIEQDIKRITEYDDSFFSSRNVRMGLLLLVLCAGILVFVLVRMQLNARSIYFNVNSAARQDIRQGNLKQGLQRYEQYIEDYPYSYKRFAAKSRKIEIRKKIQDRGKNTKISDQEDEKRNGNERTEKENINDTEKVADIRDKFLDPDDSTPYSELEDQLVRRMKEEQQDTLEEKDTDQLLSRIRSKQKKASSALEEAQQLTENGELKKARARIKKIRNEFARTEAAENVFFPVKFSSLPPGVTLYIDKKEAGITPLTYKFDQVRPYDITAVKRFHDKKQFQISPLDDAEHTLVLEKKIAWEKDLSSAITTRPLLLNDMLFTGTVEGLIWNGTYDRRERWSDTFRKSTAVRHLLSSSPNNFYALYGDGTLLSFHPASERSVTWKRSFSDEELLEPIIDPNTGHLLLPSKANQIYVIDTDDGTVRSVISTPSTPLSPVLVVDERLYLLMENNTLNELDLNQGKVKNQFRIGSESEGLLNGSWVSGSRFLLSSKHQIYQVKPDTGDVQKIAQLDSALFPGMELLESSLLFVTQDGSLYRWDLTRQEKRWESSFPNPPVAGPVSSGSMVYVADETGRIHAYHGPTGKLFWTKKTPYGVPNTGLHIHNKQLIYGTDAGYLYLINLGTYEE